MLEKYCDLLLEMRAFKTHVLSTDISECFIRNVVCSNNAVRPVKIKEKCVSKAIRQYLKNNFFRLTLGVRNIY